MRSCGQETRGVQDNPGDVSLAFAHAASSVQTPLSYHECLTNFRHPSKSTSETYSSRESFLGPQALTVFLVSVSSLLQREQQGYTSP